MSTRRSCTRSRLPQASSICLRALFLHRLPVCTGALLRSLRLCNSLAGIVPGALLLRPSASGLLALLRFAALLGSAFPRPLFPSARLDSRNILVIASSVFVVIVVVPAQRPLRVGQFHGDLAAAVLGVVVLEGFVYAGLVFVRDEGHTPELASLIIHQHAELGHLAAFTKVLFQNLRLGDEGQPTKVDLQVRAFRPLGQRGCCSFHRELLAVEHDAILVEGLLACFLVFESHEGRAAEDLPGAHKQTDASDLPVLLEKLPDDGLVATLSEALDVDAAFQIFVFLRVLLRLRLLRNSLAALAVTLSFSLALALALASVAALPCRHSRLANLPVLGPQLRLPLHLARPLLAGPLLMLTLIIAAGTTSGTGASAGAGAGLRSRGTLLARAGLGRLQFFLLVLGLGLLLRLHCSKLLHHGGHKGGCGAGG
mmetsp:Transcript_123156/g.394446  ORF Transcript_123156/g.394446 Transcript_123156/m.394446 type:complete len:426 (+) Transcript_123156:18-1295(+)